jgi:6-phosphogluconolactonase
MPVMTPTLQIFEDSETLALAAAERFIALSREAVALRGKFLVALAGGSTPERLYALLGEPECAGRVPWGCTFLFFSDERVVWFADPDSNFGMVQRTLLSHVAVPKEQLFPIPTDLSTPAACAAAYDATLREVLGEPPVFDLILLGLGDDGHTASLFPGLPALDETEKYAVASPPGTLPPPRQRVTLTFPAINAARQVLFLVSGAKKRDRLRQWLTTDAAVSALPARGVHPTKGEVSIWADKAAAGSLRSNAAR